MTNLEKRNNVRIRGDGPGTIVFAHGFGCDQNMWRLLEPHFRTRYRTVLFDLVGSGGSDLSAYDYQRYGTLQGYAEDLVEIAAAHAKGPTVLVGHSVSSTIALLAAVAEPDAFDSVVMVGPSPCYINDGEYVGGFSRDDIEGLLESMESNYLGWSSTMAPAIMGTPERPELGEELANSFCATDPDIAQHFARVTFLSDHREDLAKIGIPSLILQCSDDMIAPTSVGEYMHRSMPKSRLVIIDNVGHCPHLSSPGASVDAMEAFLAR